MKRSAWFWSLLTRIGHYIRLALELLARVVFYIVYMSVCVGLAFYFLAVVYHIVLIVHSGELWRTTIPDALGQAFQVPFLQPFITSWQLAMVAAATYLLSLWLCFLITERLFFTPGRVKQHADPGTGPVLLSDTWFEPATDPTPQQSRWQLPWRGATRAPEQAAQTAAQADPLGYSAIADNIANTIMRSANESPYAIAIEGRWGIGKTTLMKMVEKRLKGDYSGKYFALTDKDSTTKWKNFTIWFNPWRHKRRDVQKAFMSAVFTDVPWRALSWYSSRLMRSRLLREAAVILTFLRGGRNGASKRIANQLDISAPYRNQFQADFQQFLQYWSHAEKGTRVNLVIFIDDLDRCSPSDIGPILEAMKLFFESRNCVFVLGFDPYYVARSIRKESHGLIPDGLSYLQKLVQVEYRLPQPTDRNLDQLLDGFTDKSRLGTYFERIKHDVQDYREVILECTHRTPREIKLLINSLVIALPLLQPDDYVTAFFLLLLQLCWPKTYRRVVETSRQYTARETVQRLRQGAAP